MSRRRGPRSVDVPERRQAPWPYLLPGEAAKRLGVTPEFLAGLVGQKASAIELRAIKTVTPSGRWTTLYNKNDIRALRARMNGEGGEA